MRSFRFRRFAAVDVIQALFVRLGCVSGIVRHFYRQHVVIAVSEGLSQLNAVLVCSGPEATRLVYIFGEYPFTTNLLRLCALVDEGGSYLLDLILTSGKRFILHLDFCRAENVEKLVLASMILRKSDANVRRTRVVLESVI